MAPAQCQSPSEHGTPDSGAPAKMPTDGDGRLGYGGQILQGVEGVGNSALLFSAADR